VKYIMLVCHEESLFEEEPTEAEAAADDEAITTWVDEMDGRGVRLQGDRLRPPSEATTVRVRDGEVLLGDGPFAETKEVIAGFDLIECANLDEAIEVASKHPSAKVGTIEVRPFWFQ
jgi:hypothetical protein